jgi:hypothetical protein
MIPTHPQHICVILKTFGHSCPTLNTTVMYVLNYTVLSCTEQCIFFILLFKLTENTFSFTATTLGIVTGVRMGDEWASWKLGIMYCTELYCAVH